MSSTQDNGGNTFQCKIKQEAAKIQRVPKCWLSICLICHLQGVLFRSCFVFSDSQQKSCIHIIKDNTFEIEHPAITAITVEYKIKIQYETDDLSVFWEF